MNSIPSPGEQAGHDGLSEELNKLRRDVLSLKDSLARLASQAGSEAAKTVRNLSQTAVSQAGSAASGAADAGSELVSSAKEHAKTFASELEGMAAQSPRHNRGCYGGRRRHRDDLARTKLMFAPLLGAIRSDIDRQIGWTKDQVRRQTRYTAVIVALAVVAILAALGSAAVGLVALYFWLSMQTSAFTALGIMGGGLLLLALILAGVASVRRRPSLAPRPRLQIAQPTALLDTLRQDTFDKALADNEEILNLAAGALRDGSRPVLLGTLAVAVAVGLIAGRRL